MIIYNVTVNIDDTVHDDWVKWMKNVHIPDVMSTGLFTESRFCKVLAEEDTGTTYSIQYTCANMETLEKYYREHGPRLQEEHTQRYKDKFVAFRTILEVV